VIERLKQSLVNSFVGAIALGWILADCILHFVSIFTTPISRWLMGKEYPEFTGRAAVSTGFPFQDALPELVSFLLLLLLWYALLRWLYLKPLAESGNPDATAEQSN
jgi:hypothetical protein